MALYKVQWNMPDAYNRYANEAVTEIVDCKDHLDFIKKKMNGAKCIVSQAVLPLDRSGTLYMVQTYNSVCKFIFWDAEKAC